MLSLLFGVLGADRFYRGQWSLGLLKLFTFGAGGVWAFIDLIVLLIDGGTDDTGRPLKHFRSHRKAAAWITVACILSGGLWPAWSLISNNHDSDETHESQQVSDEWELASFSQAPIGEIPDDQQSFQNVVNSSRSDYIQSGGPVDRDSRRRERSEALCKAHPSSEFSDWQAVVQKVERVESDALVVTFAVDDDIMLSTPSSSFATLKAENPSDGGGDQSGLDRTRASRAVITSRNPDYELFSSLTVGDVVNLSAKFIPGAGSEDNCFATTAASADTALLQPEYVVMVSSMSMASSYD